MLKALRLTPTVCVGFAGRIDQCLEAVREAQRSFQGNWFECALGALTEATARGECEFIVATLHPHAIFEIKGGQVRQSAAAWVGDRRAFELYQRHAIGAGETQSDERTVVHRAFREVVSSASVDGVGVMSVAVVPGDSGFEYAPSMTVTAGFTPQEIPSHTLTTIRLGGAGDGGFAESVMGAVDGAAVGVYFPHGKFGVVSMPLRTAETKTLQAETQGQFIAKVLATLGIELRPGLVLS